MRLHFLVEGSSEERFLEEFLPGLIPGHSFKVYPHQGRGKLPGDPRRPPPTKDRTLLGQLPATLRAWGRAFSPDTDRVVVLVDVDNDDCSLLLQKLLAAAKEIDPAPHCLFRFAIEELEAWYLGDAKALRRAYPGAQIEHLRRYQQDTICGTWEVFQTIIGDPIERKVVWAERMGRELRVDWHRSNRSASFAKFCSGVRRIAGDGDKTARTDRPRARGAAERR
jgi:hypothetical protein